MAIAQIITNEGFVVGEIPNCQSIKKARTLIKKTSIAVQDNWYIIIRELVKTSETVFNKAHN